MEFGIRMKVSLRSSYLSIISFPTMELPDFTLITGPNGAGKSHFLKAIEGGNIQTDIAPWHANSVNDQIRFFDWATLVPQETGYFASEMIRNERTSLYQNIQGLQNNGPMNVAIHQILARYDIPKKYQNNIKLLEKLSDEELDLLSIRIINNTVFRSELSAAVTQVNQLYLNQFDPERQRELKEIARVSDKHIFGLTEADILSATIPTWGGTTLFQQSFGRLFVAYRDVYLENELKGLQSAKGNADVKPLSDDDFQEKYGPAPWDFVNESLREADLGFSINKPEMLSYSQYSPQLTKNGSNSIIPFGSLSSGEKVLMSFAFCVYYARDQRQISTYPKIILLDEIDAPLHPSMSKNLLRTITETLVSTFGIKVIATTHSPSTVALAPEDSIFVMRSGDPGLHKVGKAQALNVLTVGVPTIAMSFDGRRQVLVESHADATTYDMLYRQIKPKILSERSLEFIPTGTKSSMGSEINTGCEIVKKLVQQLSDAGNISVYGLIDWDGKNDPSGRIAVLAHKKRNGIENILLDPLLLASLICREFPNYKNVIDIPYLMSWVEFAANDTSRLQVIVTKIAEIVLGGPALEVAVVEYAGGFCMSVDARYLLIDDHLLEKQILEAFPALNGIVRSSGGGSAGRLVQHIIERVLLDQAGFMPIEIEQTFKELLERHGHH